MPSIIGRGRQVGVLDAFAADMQRTQGSHLHRTGLVKPGNYYAGHHKAQGVLVTVTRSGRTKLLDPRCDLRNNASTGFAWGYNGSGPAQLARQFALGASRRLRPKRASFRRTSYRLPVHLAQTDRLIVT
jgi:hypothetical protein